MRAQKRTLFIPFVRVKVPFPRWPNCQKTSFKVVSWSPHGRHLVALWSSRGRLLSVLFPFAFLDPSFDDILVAVVCGFLSLFLFLLYRWIVVVVLWHCFDRWLHPNVSIVQPACLYFNIFPIAFCFFYGHHHQELSLSLDWLLVTLVWKAKNKH